MTTYRLPEALGGGEYECRLEHSNPVRNPNLVGFEIDGAWFYVAKGLLTEVKSLPPEPAFGSVLSCEDGYLHTRKGRSWNDHGDGYCTWEQLNAAHDRPLVRLVPDPFVEPVKLPYRRTDEETDEYVAVSVVDGRVLFGVARLDTLISVIPPAYVTVEDALAILAAHRQIAEATS